jgi:hypothetical protein
VLIDTNSLQGNGNFEKIVRRLLQDSLQAHLPSLAIAECSARQPPSPESNQQLDLGPVTRPAAFGENRSSELERVGKNGSEAADGAERPHLAGDGTAPVDIASQGSNNNDIGNASGVGLAKQNPSRKRTRKHTRSLIFEGGTAEARGELVVTHEDPDVSEEEILDPVPKRQKSSRPRGEKNIQSRKGGFLQRQAGKTNSEGVGRANATIASDGREVGSSTHEGWNGQDGLQEDARVSEGQSDGGTRAADPASHHYNDDNNGIGDVSGAGPAKRRSSRKRTRQCTRSLISEGGTSGAEVIHEDPDASEVESSGPAPKRQKNSQPRGEKNVESREGGFLPNLAGKANREGAGGGDTTVALNSDEVGGQSDEEAGREGRISEDDQEEARVGESQSDEEQGRDGCISEEDQEEASVGEGQSDEDTRMVDFDVESIQGHRNGRNVRVLPVHILVQSSDLDTFIGFRLPSEI